jgi:hypothetical protein
MTRSVREAPGVEVMVGDVVTLRKPHPCGANEWQVTRIGADIGLKCAGCGRRLMLPRDKFNKEFKKYLSRAGAAPDAPPEASGR